MKGFLDFVRKQGVVGLAVGFILGGAVSKVVAAVVSDIVNPFLGLILGSAEGLSTLSIPLGKGQIAIGHFIMTAIDFTVIALVVYFGVHVFKLDRLDKKE